MKTYEFITSDREILGGKPVVGAILYASQYLKNEIVIETKVATYI